MLIVGRHLNPPRRRKYNPGLIPACLPLSSMPTRSFVTGEGVWNRQSQSSTSSPNRMSQRKKTVIDILRDSHDFVSGEAISDVLGISRNAVHKHVKSLRKRGYRIVGVSRRGYRLEDEPAASPWATSPTRTESPCSVTRSATTTRSSRPTSRRSRSPAGRARGHRGGRRGADRRARPARPPLDVAGRQGPALLRHPAAGAADERGAPAHHRGGDGRGRGASRSTPTSASPSSGPTTSSSATARSAASSWRSPASRTRSTGSSSASA